MVELLLFVCAESCSELEEVNREITGNLELSRQTVEVRGWGRCSTVGLITVSALIHATHWKVL